MRMHTTTLGEEMKRKNIQMEFGGNPHRNEKEMIETEYQELFHLHQHTRRGVKSKREEEEEEREVAQCRDRNREQEVVRNLDIARAYQSAIDPGRVDVGGIQKIPPGHKEERKDTLYANLRGSLLL